MRSSARWTASPRRLGWYPPYNIERIERDDNRPERYRITLAVAGFTRDELDITLEENQLIIRGRQLDDKSRQYLHRGIAARQFQRVFLLADGMEWPVPSFRTACSRSISPAPSPSGSSAGSISWRATDAFSRFVFVNPVALAGGGNTPGRETARVLQEFVNAFGRFM